ncbi:MAG: hypothetical protein J6X28_00720 [Bacilli bacterium]|nr:hypothetical protein [Bacilli bacterium]
MDNNIQQQLLQQQQQLQQQQKSNKRYFAVIILLLLILGLSVGYSILSANFNINGTSTIQSSTWEIGIGGTDIVCPTGQICTINPDNPETLTPDDGGPNGAIIWTDGNTVYFKHILAQPGDVFTFTAKYTNTGSIDAEVTSVVMSSLNATAQQFMTYDVTYANGDAIGVGDMLTAGASATFKVTVAYKDTVATLPTAEQLALINETADGHTGATSLFTITYSQA